MITKEAVCNLIWYKLWMTYHYEENTPPKKHLISEIETLLTVLEKGDLPLELFNALDESGFPLEGMYTY